MTELTHEVIHLLGYLTENQWKDAYRQLDKSQIKELDSCRHQVEKAYRMLIDVDVEPTYLASTEITFDNQDGKLTETEVHQEILRKMKATVQEQNLASWNTEKVIK